jgi:parallel beta-helix repeat protein
MGGKTMNKKATWLLAALSAGAGLLAMLLAFIQPARAAPGDILVDRATGVDQVNCGNGVNPPCYSIKYAVENVAAAGDSVLVAAGTYTEPFTMQPGVVILSQSRPDVTIIDGAGVRGPMVSATSQTVTSTARLEGFTITGGNDRGVNIERASPVISNCTIYDNYGSYGGGIAISQAPANVLISHSRIVSNTAGGDSGGIFADYGATLTLVHSTVASNTAQGWGGGVLGHGSTMLTITNCIVYNNHGTFGGGIAIAYASANALVSHSWIVSNTASGDGGGIWTDNNATLTLVHSTVASNTAQLWAGGVIGNGGATLTISDTLFQNNHGSYGGGLLAAYTDLTLLNNEFYFNTAAAGGAGIHVLDGSTFEIRDNTIEHNEAQGGGGVEIDGGTGGASDGVIISNTIRYNRATANLGGGVAVHDSTAVISGNLIVSNTADNHGGAGIYVYGDTADVEIFNNTIERNVADHGAGIYIGRANVDVISNTIAYNETDSGNGAGIRAEDSVTGLISQNQILSNTAHSSAGGIALISAGQIDIRDNTIAYNSGTYGTAIEIQNGDGEIYANEIHHNETHSGGSGRTVSLWGTGTVAIHHNWVVNNPSGGFDLKHTSLHLTNNVIANPSSVPQITIGDHTPAIVNNTIVGAGASDGILLLISAGVPTITNNIIVSNTYGIRSEGAGIPTTSHNNVWGNTTGNYEGIAPGTTDISCNPDFVDAASDDYHLGICSCAVDTGTNADAPADDYDGNARPVDGDGYGTAIVDIGAYERLTATTLLPKAGFTYTINSLTADFVNTSEHAVSYEWDFGDGVGTSAVTNPSYTYEEPGSYTVTLKALCAYGCSDAYQAIVEAKQYNIYLPLILAEDAMSAPEKTAAPASVTTAFVLPIGLLAIGGSGLVLTLRPWR